MTLSTSLARCTQALGSSADRSDIFLWLAEIEGTVIREIAETHEGTDYDASPLTEDSDPDRELFVPDPFSELYVLFAVMKNDLRLRDTRRYLNSAAVFQAAYSDFADWFNRTHRPAGIEKIRV